MSGDLIHDWARSREWPTTHAVRRAFTRLAASTYARKQAGFGVLPPSLAAEEAAVLRESRSRLLDASYGAKPVEGVAALLDEVAEVLRAGAAPGGEGTTWLGFMGLDRGTARSAARADEGRDYVLAQYRAIQAHLWTDPAQAVVFAAAQAAVHHTLSTTQGQEEPEVTVDLMKEFTGNIRNVVIDAMERERVPLPEGSFLDVATASMTNRRDRLGADFAVVTGFLSRGVTRYRVALFQAKWDDGRGRLADVSHRSGAQLDELLATGMGYYVFYPRVGRTGGKARPVFLPTVRAAGDVHRDVHPGPGRFVPKVSTCVGAASGDVAWEFAAFLALALASPRAGGFGRLFDTPEEVARILSGGRRRPLAREVLAYDLTPGRSLNLSAFVEALGAAGYDRTGLVAVPSRSDTPGDPDTDGEPDGTGD
ncbi:hypothetical protein [Methylobacterium sp. JK268]